MNDSLALGLAVGQRGQRLSISTGFTARAPGAMRSPDGPLQLAAGELDVDHCRQPLQQIAGRR